MTMLCLFAIVVLALSLFSAVQMHEKHSWERKTDRGARAKLLARQREDRRLLAKVIFLWPVTAFDFLGGLAKDMFAELLGYDMSCATPGIFHASCYVALRGRR